MAELGCQQKLDQVPLRSGGYNIINNRARDSSPDSVIFTLESNFSLFSSASASVDRCSFTSDAQDHDSLASEGLPRLHHLAGNESSGQKESCCWSGPDPDDQADPNNKNHSHSHASTRLLPSSRRSAEKAKIQNEDKDNIATTSSSTTTTSTAIEDDSQLLDSARSSFSLALQECRDRRSRSEAIFEKPDRRRPASLDLNNVVVASSSSPRLGPMNNKSSIPSRRSSGTFPSPGTPNYRPHHHHHSGVGMQKGWNSERVPLHAIGNRRQASAAAAALLPLNSGKTLPSKWEDAERWILSPVSGDGAVRAAPPFPPPQRRPKSKSGPLGPPGVAYYSLYSPAVQVFDGGNVGSFFGGSPFSAGVIAADGLAIRSNNSHGLPFAPPTAEPCMARSVSVHGCSELIAEFSLASHDEKLNSVKDAATDISRTISRRDMATQMSPEGSNHSSPCRGLSFSPSTPSALPIVEVQSVNSSKSEVRDVQVDERVTLTRWSKRHKHRNSGKSSDIIDDWRKKAVDVRSSGWDVSETAKSISKVKREEAKITAWENLQKAKAEAAIRKLEMKLEKKRSSSMDKIMNKLRSAQKKAQEMRSSVLTNQAHQVSWTSRKAISFRKTRQMSSLSGCFTCHAF